MSEYRLPYIKEKNILQLGLFHFGKAQKRPIRTEISWADNGKECQLICDCSCGVPSAFDLDTYTACMRIWFRQGRSNNRITTNYSEIARELGLDPAQWNGKIKKSLLRLSKARYELRSCFKKRKPDGEKEIGTAIFSLFNAASLWEYQKGKSKKKSKFVLEFPEKLWESIESDYYQTLDMAWYRALPEGLPRRIYEYLAKRRLEIGNSTTFHISEEFLCRWLPVLDQHTTRRRARLQRIADDLIKAGYLRKYDFDPERKVCRFTYAKPGPPPQEIVDVQGHVVDATTLTQPHTPPELTRTTTSVTWGEVLAVQEWLESIPYMHKRKIKAIASLPVDQITAVYPAIRAEYEQRAADGQSPGPAWIYEQFHERIDAPEPAPRKHKSAEQPTLFDLEGDPEQESENDSADELQKLCALVSKNKCPHIPKTLETAIKKSLDDHGAAYVAGCIEYANRHSRKNYPKYLKDTLNGDYACDLIETKRAEEENEKRRRADQLQEAEERQAQQEKQNNEVPRFLAAIANIPESERRSMWEQAEQKSGPQARSMQKAIEYKAIVLEHLAGNGEIFDKSVVSALDVARDIAGEFIKI